LALLLGRSNVNTSEFEFDGFNTLHRFAFSMLRVVVPVMLSGSIRTKVDDLEYKAAFIFF